MLPDDTKKTERIENKIESLINKRAQKLEKPEADVGATKKCNLMRKRKLKMAHLIEQRKPFAGMLKTKSKFLT